ncbi:MAG: isopropylmalate/homocitrate/citramalate synthase [Alphaproteobacteria bacterium]|nr:isopropylmalate/homocitrate/citramalate synthase [Alphaproteobacteria bacterium]
MRAAAEDLIRRYYQAFNAGDDAGLLALLHPEVAHDINQGGRETGRQAFARFLAHMRQCYAERVEDLVLLNAADGRHVAAEFRVAGCYLKQDGDLPPAGGQPYDLPVGAFFELRDGLIARVTTYYNLADWLRQVTAR